MNLRYSMLCFVVLLLETCVLSGEKQTHDKALEFSLSEVLLEENTVSVDLQEFVSFAWEEAYLLTPYIPVASVRDITGDDTYEDKSYLDRRDDIYVLVFLTEQDVTHYVELPSSVGITTVDVDREEPITPNNDTLSFKPYPN